MEFPHGVRGLALNLDWVDVGGLLQQASKSEPVGARIINASLDQQLHNGFGMEHLALPGVDVNLACDGFSTVGDVNNLLAAPISNCGRRNKYPCRSLRIVRRFIGKKAYGCVHFRTQLHIRIFPRIQHLHFNLHRSLLPVRLRGNLRDLAIVLLVGIRIGGDNAFLCRTESSEICLRDIEFHLQIVQVSHR